MYILAQALGQRFIDISSKIDKAESAQRYQTGDKQVERGILFRLYAERDRVLEDINTFGSAYIPGQNTEPMGDISYVSFG